MTRRIVYGALLWLIPYVTAVGLLPLIKSDPTFFKTIMIVEGSLLGAVLTAHYFQTVSGDFLKEGLLTAAVWIGVNWLLDVVALLPFTSQTIWRYLAEIGLRYLAMAAPLVAVGWVLQRRNGSP